MVEGPLTLGRVINYNRTQRRRCTLEILHRETGISVVYLRKIEHDQYVPAEGKLLLLEQALRLAPGALLKVAGRPGRVKPAEIERPGAQAKTPDLTELHNAALQSVLTELMNNHWPWINGTQLENWIPGGRENIRCVVLGRRRQWYPGAVIGFDLPDASPRTRRARTEDLRAYWAGHSLGYLELDPDMCRTKYGYVIKKIEAYFDADSAQAEEAAGSPAFERKPGARRGNDGDLRLV